MENDNKNQSIGFQEKGADQIYQRLFSDTKGKKRFLLADEVGLGKTITASNVIDRILENNPHAVTRIGYICNNLALAQENKEKLMKNIKNAKPRIIRGDRLSLFVLDYYGFYDSTTKYIFNSLKDDFNNNSNRMLQYIYWLAPISDKELLFQFKNEFQDWNNWSKCLIDYKGTSRMQFFETSTKDAYYVKRKIDKYFRNNAGEIERFCECVNTEWEKNKNSWLQDHCGQLPSYKQIKKISIKDPVTMKLLREIVEFKGYNLDLSYTENIDSYVKNSDIINEYMLEYMNCIREQIEKTNLEIYTITNQTSLEDASKEGKADVQKKSKVEERMLAYLLSPIRIGDTLFLAIDKIMMKWAVGELSVSYAEDVPDDVRSFLDGLYEAVFDGTVVSDEEKKLISQRKRELLNELKGYYDKLRSDSKKYMKMRNDFGEFLLGDKENRNKERDLLVRSMDEYTASGKENEWLTYMRRILGRFAASKLNFDLMIADEIQNYSDSITQTVSSDLNNAAFKLFGEDKPVLLMSATPFPIYSQKQEMDEPAEKNDPDDSETKPMSSQNIYESFIETIKYLLPDGSIDQWKGRWEEQESKKKKAVEAWKTDHDSSHFEEYKEAVRNQEGLLIEANIMRTERLSSDCATVFQQKNVTVPIDSVLVEEILRAPRMSIVLSDYDDIVEKCGGEIYFGGLSSASDEQEDDDIFFDDFCFFYKKENKKMEFCSITDALFCDIIDGMKIMCSKCYKVTVSDCGIEEVTECDGIDYKNQYKEKLIGIGKLKSTPAIFSYSEGYAFENYTESEQTSNHTIDQSDQSRKAKKQKLFADGGEKPDEKEGLLYNARVKLLIKTFFDDEKQHRILFIPPIHVSDKDGLSGVFKGMTGVSKRLFFSRYGMTTESLSDILNHEAERRQINDWENFLKDHPFSSIPVVSGGRTELVWDKEQRKFFFQDVDPKKNPSTVLFDYDKSRINDNNNGSPYAYTNKRNDIFPRSEVQNFCKHYFRYMTSQYSLRVLMAYVYADGNYPPCTPLYDLIMAYGASGCIHDVMDEYFFAIEYKEEKSIFTVSEKNKEEKNKEDSFAIAHNSREKTNEENLAIKIKKFLSPFLPFQFISTSIGQEGFDFHLYCRKIVHWTLTHDPVKFEQREGRINRYHCYANRLRAESLRKDSNTEWQGWDKLFSDLPHDKTGLVPDFVTPMPKNGEEYCNFVREFYYYPESYEAKTLKDVLKSLGSYRALLGRCGDYNYEDDFDAFADAYSNLDGAKISDLFVDISPDSYKRISTARNEEIPAPEAPATARNEEIPAPEKTAALQPVKVTGTVKAPDIVSFAEWYGDDIRANIINGKKLIVGHPSNGKTLLLREAAERNGLAGVEAVTITETAVPIVAESLVQSMDMDNLRKIHLEPISHNTAICIILDIICRKYVHRENILTYSTAEEILRTVNMLRMNGLKECENNSVFHIGEILTEYESFLKQNGLYDKARLLQESILYLEELHGAEKRCAEELHGYAFLDDHTPDALETKLINLLTNNNVRTVSEGGTTLRDVRFFKAYGMMDEVLTIAKEIQSKNLVSGDTAIYYTDLAYVDMIKCIFGEMNIPVYFKGGISAEKDSTIRLWLSILDWWKNDCRMEYFENILLNPVVQIPGEENTDKDAAQESGINEKSKSSILKYISRNMGYLYGGHNMKALAKRFSDKGTEHNQTKKRSEDMTLEFIHDLTEIFCAGSMDRQCKRYKPSDFFFNGLMRFTEKYHIPDKEYSDLKRNIEVPLQYITCIFDFDGLYSLLSRQIKGLRLSEQYTPDAVTVQRFTGQKTISPAMNTYIIGLSSSLVLKKADESPLISDEEISRLLPKDTAKKYLGSKKNAVIQDEADYLVSCMQDGGTLTVSYPYYDQSELKIRSLSGIFESLYKKYGNQAELTEHNSLSFLDSAEAFDKRDSSKALFALEKLEKEKTDRKIITDTFLRVMEETGNKKNTKTQNQNTGSEQKIKLRLSASSFDTLLNCPRKYFIENKFGIHEEPEQETIGGWLKPNQKGTVFHNVMEEYISSFCGEEEKLSAREPKETFRFDKGRFETIFERVISEYDIIPYDLPADKKQDIKEIKEVAEIYLKELASVQQDGYVPCSVEYKFKTGQKAEDTSDLESSKVFTDQIGGFELEYTIGFLDRVDKKTGSDGKSHFRIVDYKTGSLDKFIEDHTMILVQHYVYQKALQETLGSSGIVDGFEFIFPFDRSRSIWEYREGEFIDTGKATTVTKIIVREPDKLNEHINSILDKYESNMKKGICPAHDVSFNTIYPKRNAKYDKRAAVKNCRFIDICGGCADRS